MTEPTLTTISLRLRDGEGHESQDYVDDIMRYPPGSLGSVRLRVVGAVAPGLPLRGALLRVVDSEIEPTAVSGVDGVAALDSLVPGTYLLEIALPGQPVVERQAVVTAGGILDLGDVVVGAVADPLFANGFE